MSIQFREYDADRISAALGPYNITTAGGLAEDSFVTVKFLSPVYMSKVGVDGTVTRSRTNDRRFQVTITVMQSSDANIALAGFVQADLELNNGLSNMTPDNHNGYDERSAFLIEVKDGAFHLVK